MSTEKIVGVVLFFGWYAVLIGLYVRERRQWEKKRKEGEHV